MKWMIVGAALGIGGMLLGFAFATKMDVLAEAKWWDLMTAFGTVGAVVVAIAIPMSERIARDRKENKGRVVQDWANARDVQLCIGQMKELCAVRREDFHGPRVVDVDVVRVRLESIASRNHDPLGADVVARVLDEVAVVRRLLQAGERNVLQAIRGRGQLSARLQQFTNVGNDAASWVKEIEGRAGKLGVSLGVK